ncbi:MAG: 2-amino-4-hydroxy-6-hydroxymethyldihydropteridine diphosphokinase [Bacteroidaceae bacterium]|nr:2-amino-4-hydroxy-6-hydroxymethyldihydropteridine diphosphokinase [Bacteroidaceae bacterium]
MAALYLSLGTNQGDRKKALETAAKYISERIGRIVQASAVYETEPWGFDSNNLFLNQVLCIDTTLKAVDILDLTQQIEIEMGRTTKSSNGVYSDRVIDIDILLYGDICMQTERLTIPHPLMQKRRFVLEPLAEIAAHTVHPVSGKTIKELLEQTD